MTVKQLIRKLNKMPEDAEIVIPNDSLYIDGHYYITNVLLLENDIPKVVLISDYKTVMKGCK